MNFLYLSVTFLLLLSVLGHAQDLKVVAVSTNDCQEKLKVLAKSGDKFVYIDDGHKKIKLMSEDGSAFSEESGKSISFSGEGYTFIQPSVVDPNPARLEYASNGLRTKCKLKLK